MTGPPGRLLAFDCSGSACSSALWWDGAVVASRFEAMERGQAEALLPQIRDLLAEAGTGFGALDALAITVGPGSFTGIRIGLAAARGLALASGLPIRAVTGFEAVRAGVEAADAGLAVAIDSRRGPVFVQLYAADGRAAGAAHAVAPDHLIASLPEGRWLLAGDGVRLVGPTDRPGIARADPIAAIRADWVARAAIDPRSDPSRPPSPLYLRPPDVTMPGRS